jgi:hypothetical protein
VHEKVFYAEMKVEADWYHVTVGNFLNLYIGSYGEINKNSY